MANRLILGYGEYVSKIEKMLFGLPYCDVKYPSYETIVAQVIKLAGATLFEEEVEFYCTELSYHFSNELSYIVNDLVPVVRRLSGVIRQRYVHLGCLDSEKSCMYRFSEFINRYDIVVWRD